MLIRCPDCGETCETDTDIAVGQHVVCPFCEVKFAYDEGCRVEPFKTLPIKPIPAQETQDASYCADGLRLVRPLAQAPRSRAGHSASEACEGIPNHRVGAILLCVFLLPVGVAALVFALQVDERNKDGNVVGAKEASRTAGTIVKVGTIAAIAMWSITFVYFLVLGLIGANEERKMLSAINNAMDTVISTQQN